jgi:hypothetical protein
MKRHRAWIESWQVQAQERSSPRPDSSVVERGPEKAGVGGSIPSLATTFLAMIPSFWAMGESS